MKKYQTLLNLKLLRCNLTGVKQWRYFLFALSLPTLFGAIELLNSLTGNAVANAASSERIARIDSRDSFGSTSQMLSGQAVLLISMGIASLIFAIWFHRQTRETARNYPLALTPGKRSRFSARGLFSTDFHLKIFAWEYLVSWALTLGIALFYMACVVETSQWHSSTISVSLVGSGIVGFFLACYLDQHYTSLRPRVDARNGQPMKPMLRGDLADRLSDAEQVAWKLGSIQPEGWYSTVDPSAVYIRIFDRTPSDSYSKCPNCQEYIVSCDENILEKPTYKHDGVRCISYRCNCCDYFDAIYVSIPRKQPARGHAPGNPGIVGAPAGGGGGGGGGDAGGGGGGGGGDGGGGGGDAGGGGGGDGGGGL